MLEADHNLNWERHCDFENYEVTRGLSQSNGVSCLVGHSLHKLEVWSLEMGHLGASSGACQNKENVDEDSEDKICVDVVVNSVNIHIIIALINIPI